VYRKTYAKDKTQKNKHTLPGAEAFQSMGCVSGVAESSSFHILIVLSACTITNEQESISATSLLQHIFFFFFRPYFGDPHRTGRQSTKIYNTLHPAHTTTHTHLSGHEPGAGLVKLTSKDTRFRLE
jgi:hypothetical protein